MQLETLHYTTKMTMTNEDINLKVKEIKLSFRQMMDGATALSM